MCKCLCVVQANVRREIKFDPMKNQNENKSNGQNLHFKRAALRVRIWRSTKSAHKYITLPTGGQVIMHRFSQSLSLSRAYIT